jgi:transposase
MDPPCSCPAQPQRWHGAANTRSLPCRPRPPAEACRTIGIDIGKNTFHLIGLDKMGAIVLRQKLSRNQVDIRLANMPRCLIGMEACVGAHHLSRQLKALGHDARLMPARYVRPYSKGQKNDFRDAKAIAEAVLRPTMKFFAIKTVEQLDLQGLHRVRERLVCQRSSVINQIRAFLLERGPNQRTFLAVTVDISARRAAASGIRLAGHYCRCNSDLLSSDSASAR